MAIKPSPINNNKIIAEAQSILISYGVDFEQYEPGQVEYQNQNYCTVGWIHKTNKNRILLENIFTDDDGSILEYVAQITLKEYNSFWEDVRWPKPLP